MTITLRLSYLFLAFLPGLFLLSACKISSERNAVASEFVLKKNYGITSQAKEIRLPVQPGAAPQYLLIENPHINIIEVKSTGRPLRWKTGDHFPFSTRPVESRFFVFPLGVFTTSDTLQLLLNKSGENLSFVARLMDEKTYHRYSLLDNYMIGGIMGFYGLAILLSLTLYFYNRSLRFLFFLAYVFFSVWWMLNDAGILFANWWPTATAWHQSSRGFFSSLTMVLFGLYLFQNPDALIGRGIKVVVKAMLILLSGKWLISFLAAAGYFPSSVKFVTMYVNSVFLLLLFGGVIYFLMKFWGAMQKNRFEVLAIIIYCAFVGMLALREIGVPFMVFESFHQLEALFFFPLQCFFMSAHLYKTTKEEREVMVQDLRQLQLQQQRKIEETVAEVEASEKKRIAQNLHDEIGGIFIALKYQSLILKQRVNEGLRTNDLDYFIQLADEGIKRQYRIIDELQTTLEHPKGLSDSLRAQIDLLAQSSALTFELQFEATEDRWPSFLKAQLYRIILELLTNTIKHANADRVRVLIKQGDAIEINYSDNGNGFKVEESLQGNGLQNIRQRIAAMKGHYELTSNEHGTSYFIKIPLTDV